MKIKTFPTPKELIPDLIVNKTVILVDILRFSTTILAAFKNGARVALPVRSGEQAISLLESIGKEEAILCGERRGKKIDGFVLGNSPLEYKPEIVKDKTLIITTTNGTNAITRIGGAKTALIGAFINLSKITDFVKDCDDLYLLCAGQDGEFALEDFLFCGALAKETRADDLDDATRAALLLYNNNNDLTQVLKNCDHGRYLSKIGFNNDVEYAAQINTVDINLTCQDGRITRNAS